MTANASWDAPATLGWRDLGYIASEGVARIGDRTVAVGPGHIRRWQDDPDGRFALALSAGGGTAQLGRFFPSL